jgi:GTPase
MRHTGLIAVIGRPNVGKSTLINHILGESLSIVTSKAQTTRERVLGIFTESKGQMIFIDTPGIHRARRGGINWTMIEAAKESLDADLIWYLVDPNSSEFHEETVLKLLTESKKVKLKTPVFLIANKWDLYKSNDLSQEKLLMLSHLETRAKEQGLMIQNKFFISARKGFGIQELIKSSWAHLPQGPLLYPDEESLSDRPVRFFVSEKIREQLYLQLGEELPYSCAVEIEKFEENKKPVRIEAVIYVERDSQKGMVIGARGLKIKSIGQVARKKIETLLSKSVFLGLQVKVLKNWSQDSEKLKKLGYQIK